MADMIPEDVKVILRLFEGSYLVGGSVRDIVMGIEPHDYDVCTPHRPLEIVKILEANGLKVIPKGIDFGTVSTIMPTVGEIEITTFRSEVYERDRGRKPIVTFGATLEEDLSRRDFSINAMAISLDGSLIDPFGGMEDIKAKIIRFVGDGRERIREDPLRMSRACRFSARMGFEIVENDFKIICENKSEIHRISIERLFGKEDGEFKKSERFMAKFFQKFYETGLAGQIFGEIIDRMANCIHDNVWHHGETVIEHTIEGLQRMDDMDGVKYVIKMAYIFHDMGKPDACSIVGDRVHFYDHAIYSYRIAEELLATISGMRNDTKKEILFLVGQHMKLPMLNPKKYAKFGVDYILRNIPLEWIKDMTIMMYADGMNPKPDKGLYNKMKIVYDTPRPDGNKFKNHFPAHERNGLIKEAWILAARKNLFPKVNTPKSDDRLKHEAEVRKIFDSVKIGDKIKSGRAIVKKGETLITKGKEYVVKGKKENFVFLVDSDIENRNGYINAFTMVV